MFSKKSIQSLFILMLLFSPVWAITHHEVLEKDQKIQFLLSNEQVSLRVSFDQGLLISERLETNANYAAASYGQPLAIDSDADFALDLFWTDWRFPGRANNGDNRVSLDKSHFRYKQHRWVEEGDGFFEVTLEGIDQPLEVQLAWSLGGRDYFVRRRVGVSDQVHGGHFLERFQAYAAKLQVDLVQGQDNRDFSIFIEGSDAFADAGPGQPAPRSPGVTIIKEGSFGQPAALVCGNSGAFFGLEYPAAENHLTASGKTLQLNCWQEIGETIGREPVYTEWVVLGLSPNSHVKHHFFSYLDRIRVAPLKPYTLYNSWYDLRSVEYPKVPESHFMNQENVMRMVDRVTANMIGKHGIQMDGFVLDDGWDVYDSDWALRQEQFPEGMKPIADALARTNTTLGIWFGPTGGYSFKMRRLAWMKANGYEVIQDYDMTYDNSMLCLAGKNYSRKFKQRVVDFVRQDKVGFFKWDGIQFACSDPSHGHPVGPYSRRATMETVIDLCKAVRTANPDIYLNITSGTWLSPWWLKYSNQIWMDGADYAFANVPSISKRDNAITYRDFVLYDDFHNKDLWFPIANLMTHGIIKGKLDHIGGNEEPIDKYTDNALFYFARGVSMWELYISPDILTDAEWDATSQAITWARDRFDLLKETTMVGGDPMGREAYGYVHFDGERGIVAVRNPFIQPQTLRVKLDSALGLSPDAANLVVERIYPTRYIDPRLYAADTTLSLDLEGYETAVFEIFPLESENRPLLAGVVFDELATETGYQLNTYQVQQGARLLNPEKVTGISSRGEPLSPSGFNLDLRPPTRASWDQPQIEKMADQLKIRLQFKLPEGAREIKLAMLIQAEGETFPKLKAMINQKQATPAIQEQKGKWSWYVVPGEVGQNEAELVLTLSEKAWPENGELWLSYITSEQATPYLFQPLAPITLRPQPPKPWQPGEQRVQQKLGVLSLSQ